MIDLICINSSSVEFFSRSVQVIRGPSAPCFRLALRLLTLFCNVKSHLLVLVFIIDAYHIARGWLTILVVLKEEAVRFEANTPAVGLVRLLRPFSDVAPYSLHSMLMQLVTNFEISLAKTFERSTEIEEVVRPAKLIKFSLSLLSLVLL